MTDVILETERLILRPPILDDLAGWSEMMGDAEASHFIGGPLDARAARVNMFAMAGAWSLQGFGNFSVIHKETGQWIGRAGPWMPPGWPGPEVGWAFLRAYWRQGLAQEASRATISWVRETLGWQRIIHIIHPDNLDSIALAQALGSSFEDRLAVGALGSAERLLVFSQKF